MKTFMNSKQVLDLMDAAEQRVQRVSDELQKLQEFRDSIYPRLPISPELEPELEKLLEEYISLHGEMANITSKFRDVDKSWRPEMKTFMNSKKILDAAERGNRQRVSFELRKLQEFRGRVYPRLPRA